MKKFLLLIPIILLFSCHKKKEQPPERVFPVKVAKAVAKDSILYIDTIGHIEQLASIEVRSRVEGEMIKIFFKEGDEVRKDQLLFQLDPRPFENQLHLYEANLEENLANLALAEEKVKRNEALVKMQYISDLDFDSLVSNMEVFDAVIKQNRAQIADAKLNLEYTKIFAPIDGVTGFLHVDVGNLVAPNSQQPLITINQIRPIYVTFSIPEKDLPKVKKYESEKKLKLRVSFDNIDKDYKEGNLNLIDNTVNTQTGMIKLRAIFPNDDKYLWPGQFIQSRLVLTTIKNAILIPYEAVIVTAVGNQVYVKKDDSTVELRNVELGQKEDLNVIVKKGLSAGEVVVTEGQINLSPGVKVSLAKEGKKST